MSVIAAAVRELIAAGVTGDALVTAIERMEAASEPKVSAGALRTRRYRERHKASQSVTVTKSVTCDAAHIDTSSTSSKENKIKKESKKTISLSADWKPTEQGRAYAKSKGWNDQRIDAEGERFRDHSLDGARKHADVEAAWRKWVTSPYQVAHGARASPNGHAPRPGSREDRQEKTANAIAKLSEYIDAAADDARERGPVREAPPGQLPFPKLARS